MSEIKNNAQRICFDTSALIEFFDKTEKGRLVEKAINECTELFTCTVVIAELVSKLKRRGFEPEKFIKQIEKAMQVIPLNSEIAKRGGDLHFELRKTEPTISLADCLLMAHGEYADLEILTCDSHFKHYRKGKILF